MMDGPSPRESMQRELVQMHEEIKPRAIWAVDAGDGLVRLVILAVIGTWYDFMRLAPGPIILAVITAFLAPPVVRAVRNHRAEERWRIAEQIRLEQMQTRLSETTEGELLQRLAIVVQTQGRTKTGVIEAVEEIVRRSGRHPKALEGEHDP